MRETTLDQVARAIHEKAREASPQTANKHWRNLRAVARWAQAQGRAGDLPFLRLRSLDAAPAERRGICPERVREHIECLPEHIRLPVAFAVITTARSSAVCGLNVVDISPREIVLREKRRKVRRMPRDRWIDAVLVLAAKRATIADGQGRPVFARANGRRWTADQLLHQAQSAWRRENQRRRLAAKRRKLGPEQLLAEDMTLHELARHAPGTLAGAMGCEVDEIRSYLGHDSRASSEGYVHRDEQTAARIRAAIAPRLVGFLSADSPPPAGFACPDPAAPPSVSCPRCGHKFRLLQGDTQISMPVNHIRARSSGG